MSSSLQIRVDTTWLSSIAGWELQGLKKGKNGSLEVSWSMALDKRARPSALVRGARVDVFVGPFCVWTGTLAEPDWDSATFAGVGVARDPEGKQCFTGAGAVTSKPNTAIDAAIARGLKCTRIADFGNLDIAGAPGGAGVNDPDVQDLKALLDMVCTEAGDIWKITADRRLIRVTESESTPRWLILPGAVTLGVADDNVTDRVSLRYFDSAATQYRTASYPAAVPTEGVERRASIVHQGLMTSGRATTIAQGMYLKALAGRTGWTNGADLTSAQIVDMGGHPANLALIEPSQTVRLLDVVDPRGASRSLDVVLAETDWRPREHRIQLNPVGLVARTWEQVMEEANAREAS